MLKRVMFFLMSAYSAARFLAMAYTISIEPARLPLAVYLATGMTVAMGLFLLCKRIIYRIKMRQMEIYYGLDALTAIFNLIFMKLSSRLETTSVDLLIIGTVLDVVAAVTLIVLAEKERKYVKIPVPSEN